MIQEHYISPMLFNKINNYPGNGLPDFEIRYPRAISFYYSLESKSETRFQEMRIIICVADVFVGVEINIVNRPVGCKKRVGDYITIVFLKNIGIEIVNQSLCAFIRLAALASSIFLTSAFLFSISSKKEIAFLLSGDITIFFSMAT